MGTVYCNRGRYVSHKHIIVIIILVLQHSAKRDDTIVEKREVRGAEGLLVSTTNTLKVS